MEIKSGAENAYLEIPERPSYQVLRGFSAFSYENAEKYGEQDKRGLLTSFGRHSRRPFGASRAPHPLRDSRSGALTANLHSVPILARSALRAPGSCLPVQMFFPCFRRRMAQCTVYRQL